MSVKLLPEEIRGKIRSGIAINTLVDCVEALVQNAIDADANCVAVRLDLPFYKIQVIDNGRGINQHDFELIGERYATSKCNCLGDLGNTKYYGYRGEALASLREISQELTVVSRTELEDKTYAKTFRGTGSRIDVAFKRPSRGTTVTVYGFLYNLPVRQAAISGAMELEWVRRSLECLAISNPTISFSLRDDSNESWRFRVPKTDSSATTFSHIFGSVWASTLKPVSSSMPPFSISGFFSIKGHRNKNYQFLFVHKRRIASNRLSETINQLFGSFLGCNACGTSSSPRRGTEANEKYPVFVLKVECPAEFYDVGFHPSKTIVEFKKCDVLIELVKSTVNAFLSKNFATAMLERTQQDGGHNSREPLESEEIMQISAHNYTHSLHSLAAKRAHEPEANISIIEDIATKRLGTTSACAALNKSQLTDTFFTPKNPPHASIPSPKFLSFLEGDSAKLQVDHLPAEGFGPFKKPSPDLARPIHLSPALDHKRAALSKFIDVKKRQERICKAIADLKRFSHKIRHSESRPHVSFLEQVEQPSIQTLPENTVPLSKQWCKNKGHQKSCRTRSSNDELSVANPLPDHIHVNNVLGVPSTNECQKNLSEAQNETKAQETGRSIPGSRVFSPSSKCVSPDKNGYENSPKRNLELGSPVHKQPTVEQTSSADSQKSNSVFLTSEDKRVSDSSNSQGIEKSEAACSRNISLDMEKSHQQIHDSHPANISSLTIDSRLESISNTHVSETPCLSSTTFIPNSENVEVLHLVGGCEEPREERRRWFLGTEPLSKRDIYVNSETGHSYYGQPSTVHTPSLTTSLVAGHPLPLDTSISNNQLATRVLPIRPWSSKMPDSSVNASGDETSKEGKEHTVERMLKMWENPVFKVDPLLKTSSIYQSDNISNMSTLGYQPYVFNKDIFENISVIAQVDQKFIVCSTGTNGKEPNKRRLLVAFDQHAVHERIRLEDLIRDAENDNGCNRLRTTELDPPLTFRLPSHVARVCLSQQAGLNYKGIHISACNDTDGDLTEVCISQIPNCLVETGKGDGLPTVEASIIENLLCELVETLENTGTFGAEVPKIIVDALKSQACHGAIKFGDPLSITACQNLIKLLSRCKLPFFCAHGRPSIVPLFDYKLLSDTDMEVKPKLWKLARR